MAFSTIKRYKRGISSPAPEEIVAASTSEADVRAAVATGMATPGSTVVIPEGNVNLSGGDLNISGIILRGQGKDSLTPTNIVSGRITITKHSTHETHLRGFRFTNDAYHVAVGGVSANKLFHIADNYMFNDGNGTMLTFAANGGIVYNNEFEIGTAHGGDVIRVNLGGIGTEGELSWQEPDSIGNADTNGTKNIYFEDNTWNKFLEAFIDCDNGGRVVVRHNIITDSSGAVHGGGSGSSGNDTSSYGGRHMEVYENTFVRVSNEFPLNKWMWWRGSSGVFANNVVPRADSPDGSSFPNKPEIVLTVGCPGPYPIAYQVGQSKQVPEVSPSKPLLIFGNTGAGTLDPNFILIGENPNNACGTPGDFITLGRDYETTNSWGWVPFTYPHPLRV